MKQFLLSFCFFLAAISNIGAQNCIFLDPPTNSFPIMCFSDPARMDGDEITLTESQFNDENFLMSLITTSISGGGLTVDCDMNATVKVIRRRRLVSNSSASARNGSTTLSEITFETSSVVGACNAQTLSLKVRVQPNIPTMSQWGLLIFGLLMLNLGAVFIWRKSRLEF